MPITPYRPSQSIQNSTPIVVGCIPHDHARLPSARRRQVLSTPDHRCRCLYRTRRRSVCRGKISQVQSLRQSSHRVLPYFLRYPNFPKTLRSIGGEKPVYKKNQLDPSSRFDTIPACDRQTQTHRHRPISNTALA